jgi:hypothetical protein
MTSRWPASIAPRTICGSSAPVDPCSTIFPSPVSNSRDQIKHFFFLYGLAPAPKDQIPRGSKNLFLHVLPEQASFISLAPLFYASLWLDT